MTPNEKPFIPLYGHTVKLAERNAAYREIVRAYVVEGFRSPDDLCIDAKRTLAGAYYATQTPLEVDDLLTGVPSAAFTMFLEAEPDDPDAARLLAYHLYASCEGDIRRDFESAEADIHAYGSQAEREADLGIPARDK